MLQKLRKATAVVSVLLVTITITLTLTLTVSATSTTTATTTTTKPRVIAIDAANITTTITTTTTTSAIENTEKAAVLSKKQQGNDTTTAAAETTTTTFLTLQPPPLNVTSSTTSSYEPESKSESKDVTAAETSSIAKNSINHEIDKANNVDVKSDKIVEKDKDKSNNETKLKEKEAIEKQVPIELIKLMHDDFSHNISASRTLEPKHFTLPESFNDQAAIVAEQEQRRMGTINEVLTSLFPNGFSDIFRFSYASSPTTPSLIEELKTETSTVSTTAATSGISIISQKPSVRYTSSVSKEYRRLISPGHTEIVVEKFSLPNTSEEFKDGSNTISKDDLLRINRAALDAPVLPSLLVEPSQLNTTTTNHTAPIVILKESLSEHDDLSDEVDDDNQIAESQDIAQHIFQRIPDVDVKPSYQSKVPEVNVKIIRDENGKQTQKREFGQRLFTPASELPRKEVLNAQLGAIGTPIDPQEDKLNSQEQDHYQQNAEKTFQLPESASEAPSRSFLKHFNPKLSESSSGQVKKGNFHYESIGRQQRLKSSTAATATEDYSNQYLKPAAQLQYRDKFQQQQQQKQPQNEANEHITTHNSASQSIATSPEFNGYESVAIHENSTPQNEQANVVFVTVNTPNPNVTPIPAPLTLLPPSALDKSPHDYVAEAVAAASQHESQKVVKPQPNAGYTYVEVQKSVNIHNKLITEKDGQLVEQHETIYHQPQYGQNFDVNEQEVAITPKQYYSLSANPINVQHIDDTDETHEEAASQTNSQHIQPPPQPEQINYVEKLVPQPYPVPVEKIVDRPYPVTQIVEKQVSVPYPVQEIVEKIVDRPVQVDKVVDRPVNVPYPVEVNRYIDRPYPVREIIEQPIAVPYAVPEPVAVPVPIETYIDRPYPVETIVEQPVPYPVEKIVEKVVEKHVPVEVERIVEKPTIVEKIVEKLVDRPIAIPIHVPVAIPVPPYPSHPNSLPWINGQPQQQRYHKIPEKVLQNFYNRMLKKLLDPKIPNLQNHDSPSTVLPASPASSDDTPKPTQPITPIQFTKLPFKISDIRYDLKPPPPPLGSSWAKGARYIYNTLPAHFSTAAVSDQAFASQQQIHFVGPHPSHLSNDVSFGKFQSWRNGHSLKRSPDFGKNLHIEYGFKPPLIPSLEIDDKGMPLKSAATKNDE